MSEDLPRLTPPRPAVVARRSAMRSRPPVLAAHARLSQRQAAGVLGISQSTYARIEAGKAPPRPALGKAISDRTGISFEVVMGVA